MRQVISLFVCCFVSVALAALPSGRTANKRVEADCKRDDDDGSLKLTFFLEMNGDPVDKFMAIPGGDFVRYDNGTTNEVECEYIGTLTTSLFVHSTVYNDNRPSLNPCGVQPYGDTENAYQWFFDVRERYADGIYTDMDASYSVICNDANSYEFSVTPITEVITLEEDDQADSIRVRPENQMSILERLPNSQDFTQDAVSTIMRGHQVKLRVQTKVKTDGFRDVGVDHYGCYVHSCDYRTTLSGPRTQFLRADGCPNFVFEEMTRGFAYARNALASPSNYEWFQTESDPFVLAKTSSNSGTYYISCYVGYCFGLRNSDESCNNYCQANSRRRRSVDDPKKFDRISISVNIADEAETETNEQGTQSATPLIAIGASLSVVLVATVILLLVLVCLRRRRRYKKSDGSSSTGSDLHLPQHQQQVKHQKL